MHPILQQLRGGLIVSCQADPGDPLRDPHITAAMAQAAVLGGAVGIRASGPEDTAAIRSAVRLPIIGIYKYDLPGFQVRITPTVALAVEIAQAGADLIALDATQRPHPGGIEAGDLIKQVKAKTGKPVLVDISTLHEGLRAAEAGADAILPTLSGYTDYSPQRTEPYFELIEELASRLSVPVIAEGRIAMPAQAVQALALGAWAVCVGSAITRPRWIAEQFATALLRKGSNEKDAVV